MYYDKQSEAVRTDWNITLLSMTEDNIEESISLELNHQSVDFFPFCLHLFFFNQILVKNICGLTWRKWVEISESLDLFIFL